MILRKISLFYSNFALTIFAYNGKLFELFVFFYTFIIEMISYWIQQKNT